MPGQKEGELDDQADLRRRTNIPNPATEHKANPITTSDVLAGSGTPEKFVMLTIFVFGAA